MTFGNFDYVWLSAEDRAKEGRKQVVKYIVNMLSLEKIHDVIGYLVLTEDGAVLSSGGELENDERSANIITGLIQITDKYVERVILIE